MDKKSYDLLHHLLWLDEPETIVTISKQLNQSRRKIYYHLEKINEALPKNVEPIVSYPRVGILLTTIQKEACQQLLKELDDYSYIVSPYERIQLILTYIAITKERVTIDKLTQLNNVSRNTVLNDLNDIKLKLASEEYDIHLDVTKNKGYYLKCHPLSKIQYLYRLLYSIYTEGSQSFIDIVKEKIVDLTGLDDYFSTNIHHYLTTILANVQQQLGKKINVQDRQFMIQILPYLLLSYRSVELSDTDKEILRQNFSSTWKRLEYQLAEHIALGMQQQFDIYLDEIEISLIAMLLLSFRKYRDNHLESQDYASMRETLKNFLELLKSIYALSFQHEEELINQLLMHSKALVYRKTYGIVSVNPLLKYIKGRYSDLFDMTKSCIHLLEENWFIKLTDDDIAYITIHLGGELKKENNAILKAKKATIVCDEGIGVQKLLLKQCRQCLKHYNIDAVITSEQFHSIADILQTDMIISTNNYINSQVPMIIVHPVLSDEDIIRLVRFSQKQILQTDTSFEQELEQLLQAYISDTTERYALKTKIVHLVSHEMID